MDSPTAYRRYLHELGATGVRSLCTTTALLAYAVLVDDARTLPSLALTGGVLATWFAWTELRGSERGGFDPRPASASISTEGTTRTVLRSLAPLPLALAILIAATELGQAAGLHVEACAAVLAGSVAGLGAVRLRAAARLWRWQRDQGLELLHEPRPGGRRDQKFVVREPPVPAQDSRTGRS